MRGPLTMRLRRSRRDVLFGWSGRGVSQVHNIRAKKWQAKRSMLVATSVVLTVVLAGVLIALAQAAQMSPPAMTPGVGATIDVTWETVAPIGANDTTYTLSYDTTFPFTATQTVTMIDTSHVIAGIDGVTYYAFIQADDGSGVLSDPSGVGQATADGIAPVSTFLVSPVSPNGWNGWYTDPSTAATISVEETNTGLQSLTVNTVDVSGDVIFGLPPDPSVYPVPALSQGVNDFSFFGTDVAGNVESPEVTASVKLDSVVPTCVLSVSSNGPTRQAILATMTAGDASPGSGVNHIEYKFVPRGTGAGGGPAWTTVLGSLATTSAPEGRLTLFARSFDVAGNISSVQQADVFVDLTAPVTTMVTVPSSPTGPSGSWIHAPAITLNVVDADPNTTTYFSWNTTNTISTVGTAPVVPTGPGTQTLRFLTVDTAGNVEATHTVPFLVLDQQTYTLTYTAGAHGSITGTSPQTVAYGGAGTQVTAVAGTGYHFVSWSDGVLTAARTDTNVTANVNVTANFAINTYTLHYTASTGGSIVGSSTQVVGYGTDGTQVTATPATGYHFVSWSDGVLTAARTDTNVTANVDVTANFAIDTFTLHYTAGAHGSIVGSSTQVVDYGTDGTQVTATPATGYHFVNWSDGVLTAARHETNVTADKSVSASFAINAYTLHYVAGTHGSIVGSSTQVVDYGGDGTQVTATPATGYHFVSWSDGVLRAARTDLNVADNLTVTAAFAIDTYKIVPSAGAHGSISPATTQTVDFGSDATFTITPSAGYHVADVLVDSVSVGAVTSYTFHDVTDDHTISATFAVSLVRTTISIVSNHSSVLRGHLVYFHGVVSPNRANGTHVRFYRRKAGSSTWTLVSTRHIFSRHHWNFYYHPATRGTYYFQVRLSATSKYAAKTSRTIKVIWR
jgi:hypothetical protein